MQTYSIRLQIKNIRFLFCKADAFYFFKELFLRKNGNSVPQIIKLFSAKIRLTSRAATRPDLLYGSRTKHAQRNGL